MTAARTCAAPCILCCHAAAYAGGSVKGEVGKLPLAPSPTAMKLDRLSEEALRHGGRKVGGRSDGGASRHGGAYHVRQASWVKVGT